MTKEELAQWRHNELGKIESIITDKKTHKDCINKEKLIEYINQRLKNAEKQYNDEFYQDLQQYIKGEIDFIKILLNRLENGEFD